MRGARRAAGDVRPRVTGVALGVRHRAHAGGRDAPCPGAGADDTFSRPASLVGAAPPPGGPVGMGRGRGWFVHPPPALVPRAPSRLPPAPPAPRALAPRRG